MSWSDSNIAGDYWKWTIYLTIRKDGTFSVGAAQTCSDGPSHRLPSIYPLRNGRQVRDAVEEIFLDDNLSSEDIDWEQITSALSGQAPKLAEQLKNTFAEDLILEREEEERAAELELKEKPIKEWVMRAVWQRSDSNNNLHRGMVNYHRGRAVLEFVHRYYAAHGEFPKGTHKLSDTLTVGFPDA
jgi:hypothetical protein